MRNRALAPLAGRKAHRSVSRSVFLRHSPLLRTEWSLLAYDEPRAFGRDTVTPPARPEESGPHFRDPRRDCPGASGRRVGPSLWRGRILFFGERGSASWESRAPASRSFASAEERFRLGLLRFGDLEDERLHDWLVFFLVHFSFVRFRERPPERLHARVVISVTHRRAFDPRHHGENTKRFAFSARACDTATNERTGGLHVSSVITLP